MRERFVTRTIKVSDVKVMVVDMENKQVETCTVTVNLAGIKDAEKAIKAALPEGKVFVAVESKVERDVLMGMPESEFIRLAKELPPRSKEEDAKDRDTEDNFKGKHAVFSKHPITGKEFYHGFQ